jgi:hypothetical protein
MTNKEFVTSQLEASIQEAGEDDSLTQMLKRQLASIEWGERNLDPLRTHLFQVGARGEHLPSTPQKAEAEEEKMQEEESVNRGRPSSALKGPPQSSGSD